MLTNSASVGAIDILLNIKWSESENEIPNRINVNKVNFTFLFQNFKYI